ncbi:hypothetical protein G3T14_22215 [Methylobacterium sp. BTF04]|uniref:hypothetical protein n=1 Tax=Methylobacterium sp. BTF04 TaxID=2708300 RepID=UPI0013D1188C|nr:hypothetical protein [Methylobacterium sp. BTF04]NEU14793.1 hypothetical protein [Methylobacterium sp. BTF04]
MEKAKLERFFEKAAHQHDRAADHYRHSARHLAKGEHTASAKERDRAIDHCEKVRIDEIGLRPDGMATDGRTKSEAA